MTFEFENTKPIISDADILADLRRVVSGLKRHNRSGWGAPMKRIAFRIRFPLSQIPYWSDRYSYAKRDGSLLTEVRPAVLKRGFLVVSEFRDICSWKTQRTQSRCRENTASQVRVLTQAALAAKDDALKIDLLRLLHGVDWPTASTLLHFCDADPYPILDYRALWSLGYVHPPNYTMTFWLSYVAFCRHLAARSGCSMRTVDRALWQYSKRHQRGA